MKKLLLSLLMLSLIGIESGIDQRVSAQDQASGLLSTSQTNVLEVPRQYATIQAAVNAARAGDTINVAAGVYNENVVISTSGLRLNASRGAVIDGNGLTGTGILVLGTAAQPVAGVEVSGFEVRGFQRGIVLQFTTGARINRSDIHSNNQAPGPPTTVDQATGIDLVTAQSSVVSENFVHKNGVAGIQVRVGSTDNTVQANVVFENGALLTSDMNGRGILVTGAGSDNNEIRFNQVHRNFGRGIVLTRPTGTAPISGNLVFRNSAHENQRCGICTMDAAQDNVILRNDAASNNLSGLAPCSTFNLFDNSPFGNVWKKNNGTANF